MLEQNDLDTKSVYKRMDFILKFSTKLPELFLKIKLEENPNYMQDTFQY